MPPHARVGTKTIRLSNEALGDFVENVATAHSENKAAGIRPDGVRLHADALRTACTQLEADLDIPTNETYAFWSSIAEIGTYETREAQLLLDAYTYTRVNRVLDVEFGPDETSTTQVIRRIGFSAVQEATRRTDPTEAVTFFNTKLGPFVLSCIYAHGGFQLHPEVADNVLVAMHDKDYRNPALARVVSTLIARGDGFVNEIDDEFQTTLIKKNRRIFKDKVSMKKLRRELLYDTKGASDKQIQDADEDLSEVPQDSQGGGLPEFNYSLAACNLDPESFDDIEQYKAWRRQVWKIMFPARGETTKPAKELCKSCEIREACLERALMRQERFGIWGGKSERERSKLRRDLKIATTDEALAS